MQALTWILPFRAFLSKKDGLNSLTAHTFHYRFHQVPCFDVFPLCAQLEHNLFFLRRYRYVKRHLTECLFPLVFKEAKELRYVANR